MFPKIGALIEEKSQVLNRHDTLSNPTSNPQNADLMSAASNAFSTDDRVTSLSRWVDHPSQFTLSPDDCVVVGDRLGSMLSSSKAFGGYQLKPGQVDCARDWSVVTKKTF